LRVLNLAEIGAGAFGVTLALASFSEFVAYAETAQPRPALMVCADPANLPYSDKAEQGFENKIAAILAEDLNADLVYFWQAEHRGFIRRTLLNNNCDLVMSVPPQLPAVITTRPFFVSSYVAVMREDDPRHFSSFSDPWLPDARIGLQLVGSEGATTSPAVALSRRGINQHITPFPMWSEKGQNTQGRIIEAVANGEIDVAFVWGPFAGYFARTQNSKLRIESIAGDPLAPEYPFVFEMAIGVRKSEPKFRDRLQEALDRHASGIYRIMQDYGAPSADLTAAPKPAQHSPFVTPDSTRP